MTSKKAPMQKPVVDSDAMLLADRISNQSASELFKRCYLSRSTIRRLQQKVTARPQHLTLKGIAEAAGYEWKLTKKRNGHG